MKKTVFLAYLALFISFLLPVVKEDIPLLRELSLRQPTVPSTAEDSPDPGQASTPLTAATPTPDPVPTPEARPLSAKPAPETIRVLMPDGTVHTLDMQDYITGVVAAEMPASFEPEALKAQAVAARSFAMYCAAGNKHGNADVCTDFACCQAWQSESEQREKWGTSYEAYTAKIRTASEATAGQYLSYEGQPVFAAFHASSAGATEASGEIWSQLPYLISVSSPETAESVPNYISSLDCSALDFRDTVLSAHPEADFTGEESGWIGLIVRDDSGRVKTAALGGVDIPGTELRGLFSLRSTAFELTYNSGRFLFTVTGNGHGVGMSQYGAQVMAAQGESYAAILAHYYPGTTLIV